MIHRPVKYTLTSHLIKEHLSRTRLDLLCFWSFSCIEICWPWRPLGHSELTVMFKKQGCNVLNFKLAIRRQVDGCSWRDGHCNWQFLSKIQNLLSSSFGKPKWTVVIWVSVAFALSRNALSTLLCHLTAQTTAAHWIFHFSTSLPVSSRDGLSVKAHVDY